VSARFQAQVVSAAPPPAAADALHGLRVVFAQPGMACTWASIVERRPATRAGV
jgi:hypothetical protein